MFSLAIGAFGIGMTEFVSMGLLPDIAQALHVSIPTAGVLISAYALGVVIGAPTLTILARNVNPKYMLTGLMALFALGNLLSALAPTYPTLLLMRILSGLPHGAFFGTGAVVAARLAPQGREAQTISLMFLGLTVANVLGVPIGTFLGQQYSWRVPFAVVSVIGMIAAFSVWRWIPALQTAQQHGLRTQLQAFRNPQLWVILGVVMVGLAGMFACFSYITPMMTDVAGFSPGAVTPILMVAGLGMVAGNLIGGRLADSAPVPSIYVLLMALVGILLLLTITAHVAVAAVVTVFLFTATAFALTGPLQLMIIRTARGAETLASAAIQSAFNISNALGAFLGGLPLAAGYGYTSPALVGAGLAFGGLIIALGLRRTSTNVPTPTVQET
ncbi:MFS transporter [Deinococcus ruber]|uniref:MFS transporter n=1 Tax=Deinococcus ruber TaxID=1848197 RepID=UPI00227D94D0|nr:MFS transporter [Deinococcus ruber]